MRSRTQRLTSLKSRNSMLDSFVKLFAGRARRSRSRCASTPIFSLFFGGMEGAIKRRSTPSSGVTWKRSNIAAPDDLTNRRRVMSCRAGARIRDQSQSKGTSPAAARAINRGKLCAPVFRSAKL